MTAIHLQPCATAPAGPRHARSTRWRARPAGPRRCASGAGAPRAQRLARLDERMLHDIGLTRADRDFLVNKPFWRE